MRRWRVGLVVLVMVLSGAAAGLGYWWAAAGTGDDYESLRGEAFATHYRITYRGGADADSVRQAVELELERIDALASTWRDDSELMRYNRADDPGRFELSAELAGLIELAEKIEAQTGGAFSPRPDGKMLDLSGIAKGYAVDRVVALLRSEFGVTDCLVDIGGEVRAVGNGPKGDGWRVGVYLPRGASDIDTPVLQLRDASVATSGAYFKGGHILDPATGLAVTNDLLSATVVHPRNATADALATAMFVMGPERGLAWAEDHGVRVIFLMKDGTRREYAP